MTPSEADARIILSQHTLHRYRMMGRAGMENMPLWREEMRIIDQLAVDHPDLADDCRYLVREWQTYINLVKLGMH